MGKLHIHYVHVQCNNTNFKYTQVSSGLASIQNVLVQHIVECARPHSIHALEVILHLLADFILIGHRKRDRANFLKANCLLKPYLAWHTSNHCRLLHSALNTVFKLVYNWFWLQILDHFKSRIHILTQIIMVRVVHWILDWMRVQITDKSLPVKNGIQTLSNKCNVMKSFTENVRCPVRQCYFWANVAQFISICIHRHCTRNTVHRTVKPFKI